MLDVHTQDGVTVTLDNHNDERPKLRRRLRDVEAALRERIDDLPPEFQDVPALLRDVRAQIEGHPLHSQEISAQLDTSRRELREAQTLLHTLIDSLPVGITIADVDGRIVMTNAAGVEILGGRPEGNVENLTAPYTVHRLSGVQVAPDRRPLFRTLRTGKALSGEEYRIRRTDGTERVVLTATKPVKDKNGTIISVLKVFQDITEKKRNEDAVQRYADRLHILREMDRAILAARPLVPIAQLTFPQLHKLLPCVRASIVLLDKEAGTLQEKVIQVGDKTLTQPEAPVDITPPWWTVIEHLERGEPYVIEHTHATDRDDPLADMWHAHAIHAHLYQPIRIHVDLIGALCIGLGRPGPLDAEQYEFIRELADQLAVAIRQARLYESIHQHASKLEDRVAERTAALRISEARFRAIFEEAPVGIALLDDKGRIIQGNAVLQAMLALDAASLEATCFFEHIHCDDVDDLREQSLNLLSGSVQSSKGECRLERANGKTRWVRVTMALVGERLDQPNLMLAMIQDITEERDAQFALIQTEKLALTGRLATSLAHEINNPLQTVIGCLGLAEEAREDDDEIDVYLAMASEELKRAASIVTRLRDLNRWSEAEQREPTDVRAIIRQALAMTRKQCEDHGIVVHTDLDVNVPDIHAIPDRLEQVFLNLTLNAIDAMPNGGTLRVGVLPMVSPDGVKIVFQDSGIGIPPEDQAHIFEAFQTTKSEGLGMGLFISQSIIEDHGGTISVRSQPDEGSTFTIQIPA